MNFLFKNVYDIDIDIGSKSAKFDLDFQPPSPLSRPNFRKDRHMGNPKQMYEALMFGYESRDNN